MDCVVRNISEGGLWSSSTKPQNFRTNALTITQKDARFLHE